MKESMPEDQEMLTSFGKKLFKFGVSLPEYSNALRKKENLS